MDMCHHVYLYNMFDVPFCYISIHPIRISRGYEKAADIAVKHLESISDKVTFYYVFC